MEKRSLTVIFDLDGTLLNSIDLIVACYEATLSHFTGKVPTREEILKDVGLPLKTALERIDKDRAKEMEIYYRAFQKENHDKFASLYPGAIKLLEDLHKREIKVGVATSKARAGLELCLHMFPKDFVQVWITADDVEHHKPHPEPLLTVAETLQATPSNCVYVGDTHFDKESASNAGMQFIGVTWGAGLSNELGNKVVDTFDELRSSLFLL